MNEYLDYWNNIYGKDNYFGTGPTKLANLAKTLFDDSTKNILELGCGQGRDAIFFAQLGYRVHAFDISKNAINYVQKTKTALGLANLNVNVHDILNPITLDSEPDFVYSNLVLQFFDSDQLRTILTNISCIMKSGSKFLLSTKKKGDKYHNKGERITDDAFSFKGVTRYFYESEIWENITSDHFKILNLESDEHESPDKTTSVWWKILIQKK